MWPNATGHQIEKDTARKSSMTSTSLTALREVFAQCREMDASLGERLEVYSQAVRKFLPRYAEAVDDLVERLNNAGAGTNAPRPGDPMPPFILPDETGRLVSLEKLLENGPAAITFHRGHWCPWCRISINALVRVDADIGQAGGQVVAIMPDRQRFAAEFKREAGSPFPVLDGHGQRLCAFAEPWLSGWGRILSGCCRHTADPCRTTRATKPGRCRSPQPSSSRPTELFATDLSIRISAGAWLSRN